MYFFPLYFTQQIFPLTSANEKKYTVLYFMENIKYKLALFLLKYLLRRNIQVQQFSIMLSILLFFFLNNNLYNFHSLIFREYAVVLGNIYGTFEFHENNRKLLYYMFMIIVCFSRQTDKHIRNIINCLLSLS
jgi:hypothetical protein